MLQVIVEGWKSYKDQTVMEPFSPKVNVIGEQLPSGGTAPIASTPALRTHPLCRLACSELAEPHRRSAVDFWVCPTFRVGQQAGPGRCQACAQLAATLLHLRVLPAVGANGSGKSNFFHGETLLLLQFGPEGCCLPRRHDHSACACNPPAGPPLPSRSLP